ncbi:putative dual specificity protein phosphatase DSP8 [Ipomoea triloba]|uniref:putative dual specificity protein phosphatase DSP8 n=1 Tax=Ipomoea triloba TaxID=35885 RepID=UPI00125D1520|nr:putative dual specificity protein phosphatase DSP8 [Ipomoea triloba]
MYIEEVKAVTIEEEKEEEERVSSGNAEILSSDTRGTLVVDVRKVVVGVGARALFYPTLLYNVVRNRIQTEFRWWDWIDEFVLLGAVPFPSDVKRLKKLGVCGVVTLNEPYETLVPTSLYRAQGIHNLVLPTRDYMFAPSLTNISQAVEFIHENASSGQRTYVHCKAGRGRSTTIVLCYLVRYKQMTPTDAYEYVKAIRPRVLLASSQWKAVQEFYSHLMMETGITYPLTFPISRSPGFMAAKNLLAFDDSSALIITEADLDGYDPGNIEPGAARNERRSDFGLIWRVRIAGVAALSRVSCLWLNCQPPSKRSIVQLAE